MGKNETVIKSKTGRGKVSSNHLQVGESDELSRSEGGKSHLEKEGGGF